MGDMMVFTGKVVTMTSLELVDFINTVRKEEALAAGARFPSKGFSELRHDHFMAKVPEVLGDAAPKFLGTVKRPQPAGGFRDYPCYRFPKREACLMAMSYSYDIQAKVFDRMTVLEERQANQVLYEIPKTYSGALMLAAKQAEQIEVLEQQKAEDAPKVEFAMAVRRLEGACKVGDLGKVLGVGRNTFFAWMRDDDILMTGNMPYQRYIDAGFFVVIEGTPFTDRSGKTHPAFTTMVTGKGQVWLERKYRAALKAKSLEGE